MAGAVAALLLAGFVYQAIAGVSDSRRFRPPGQLLSIDGRALHIWKQGTGSPAVIFEAGLAASALSWSHVQPRVAEFTRAVSYDRAGLGWSGTATSARSLDRMVDELGMLLDAAEIPPPYILVGHSFGGLVIRAFARKRTEQVAGLVFVDPVSIASWTPCSAVDQRRLRLGAKLSRRGAWLARLGVVRLAIAAAGMRGKFLTRTIAKASAGKATSLLGRLAGEIRKLPIDVVPTVRSHWSRPKSFDAMARYLECLPGCAAEAATMPFPAHIPFVVLSAASATDGELRERDEWVKESMRGQHLRVAETGHWVHLERPDAVVEAVRELVELAREHSMRHGVNDVIDSDAKA